MPRRRFRTAKRPSLQKVVLRRIYGVQDVSSLPIVPAVDGRDQMPEGHRLSNREEAVTLEQFRQLS